MNLESIPEHRQILCSFVNPARVMGVVVILGNLCLLVRFVVVLYTPPPPPPPMLAHAPSPSKPCPLSLRCDLFVVDGVGGRLAA